MLSKEISCIACAFETISLFFEDCDIKLVLLLSNEPGFDPLLDALRMFLRSLDFTFKELPVDNFVMVTEPMDEPLLAPGELGSFDSKPFEDEVEVTVAQSEVVSDPEHEDGNSLSLDAFAFEWTFAEFEETLDEELGIPVVIRSLLLTGEMVTPSLLPHFVGVAAPDPAKSLPMASSTLSLCNSLLDLNKCLLPVPSLGLARLLYALDFINEFDDSLNVCFASEHDSLSLATSLNLESFTLVTA